MKFCDNSDYLFKNDKLWLQYCFYHRYEFKLGAMLSIILVTVVSNLPQLTLYITFARRWLCCTEVAPILANPANLQLRAYGSGCLKVKLMALFLFGSVICRVCLATCKLDL